MKSQPTEQAMSVDTAKLRWRVGVNRFIAEQEPRRWVWDDHNVYEGDNRMFECPTHDMAQRIVDLLNSADQVRKDAERLDRRVQTLEAEMNPQDVQRIDAAIAAQPKEKP